MSKKTSAAKAVKQKNPDTLWSPMVKIVAAVCAVVLLATIVVAAVAKSGYFARNTVVMTVADQEISAAEFNYGYYTVLNEFYNQYYTYIMYGMIGFNSSLPLDAQKCYFDKDITWHDYFINQTKITMEEVYALYCHALSEQFNMTEETRKEMEESFAEVEKSAKESNVSVNSYLSSAYGRGMTFDLYKETIARRMLVADYYEHYMDGLTYTEDELKKEYEDNKNTYDRVSYYSYKVTVPKDSDKTAKQIADDILAATKDVASFVEAIKALENADTFEADDYLVEKSAYDDSNDTSKWLFETERKAGDAKIFTSKDSDDKDVYTVVCMTERAIEEYKLATMRHILLSTEELKDDSGNVLKDEDGNAMTNSVERKKAAEKLLNQWKADGGTLDAFIALVKDNTDDTGSKENGGLYEDFDQAYMVKPITDWIWTEGRSEGDCEIVETDYGFHLVYFVGYGETKWVNDATNALKAADYEEFLKSLKDTYKISYNEKGFSQVG